MKHTNNTAFTLVELIVVITILAVLATVAFISFQGYTSSSRDSVRLADLKNISKSFEFMKTKDQQLPLPDQKVDITASGTIFQYQGVLEGQTLKLSNIHNGGLDPLTGNPYGYAVNTQRNKFQVIGFLENSQTAGNNIFSQSFADNTDKFVKTSGDDLGILLDSNTNEVITQSGSLSDIEILNSATDYVLVMNSKTQGNTQSSNIVSNFIPNGSCLKILEAGHTQSGVYTIYPDGNSAIQVYCDLQTEGGGWALLVNSTTAVNNGVTDGVFLDSLSNGNYLITDNMKGDQLLLVCHSNGIEKKLKILNQSKCINSMFASSYEFGTCNIGLNGERNYDIVKNWTIDESYGDNHELGRPNAIGRASAEYGDIHMGNAQFGFWGISNYCDGDIVTGESYQIYFK